MVAPVSWVSVVKPVLRLGLALRLVGLAGGAEGAGDLGFGQAGLAGGDGQRAEVGGAVGVQSAIGGPVQAVVAVALGLACDPAGQVAEIQVGRRPLSGSLELALGLQEAGRGGPVQAVGASEVLEDLVGTAADLGGQGQDVAALRAEVQVMAGQAATALVRAGEVGVHSAGRGPYPGDGAVGQPGRAEPVECLVPVPGGAVLVDVQDVGTGGTGAMARL